MDDASADDAPALRPGVGEVVTVLLWVYVCFGAWLVGGPPFAPGGPMFAVMLIYTLAVLAGEALRRWTKLPPLLGMLLSGVVLRNLPGGLVDGLPAAWSDAMRSLALVVIMLRAGLGLDVRKLRAVGLLTLRLAFVPCSCEAAAVAGLGHVLLGLPPVWAALLGFVIAAVSPAVVVPGLLELQERGHGVAKGIPSVVLAAASLDDVLAISGFGICLSLVAAGAADAAGGGLVWLAFKGPVELVAGTALGLGAGALAAAVPAQLPHSRRTAALVAGGVLAVFGGRRVHLAGGGALGAVVLGCTAGARWGKARAAPCAASLNALWTAVAQPLLFGLLGAAVRFDVLSADALGMSVAVLAGGLAVRLAATRAAASCHGLSQREAAFVAVAWMPKATVQAAVGGAALDLARAQQLGAEAEAYGLSVLVLSVVAIVLTAPVGALGIAYAGPRWLTLDKPPDGAAAAAAPTTPATPSEPSAATASARARV